MKRVALWLAALALLAFAVKDVAWRDTLAAIARLDATAWGVLVVVNAGALVLFTLRWWVVLAGLGARVPLLPACACRLAAFGLSYLTPGPQFGGEPLQILLVERREGVPRNVAIASVALDRLIELTVSFAYLSVAFLYLVRGGPPVLLGLAPLLYLVALASGFLPLSRVAGRFELVRAAETAASRFCREKPGHLLLALVVSLLSFGVMFLEYGLLAHFLGMTLDVRGLVLGLTAARIAYLLFLPAALGVFEAGQIAALTSLGFAPELAVSLSLVVRARDVLLAVSGLGWGLRAASGRVRHTHLHPARAERARPEWADDTPSRRGWGPAGPEQ
jgi:uncharacterized membrane protein YbhN (UPF0104 family)